MVQSEVYTGTEHREWLLFSIRVNPSLISNNNTCLEVMYTATFMTKTYLSIVYNSKLTRLFTLSFDFSFEGAIYLLYTCITWRMQSNYIHLFHSMYLPPRLPLSHKSKEGQDIRIHIQILMDMFVSGPSQRQGMTREK